MTSNDAARPRGASAIEARMRSRRTRDGALSIFHRMNEAAIRNAADAIAHANQYRHLSEDDLTRSVQLFVQQHPDAARSTEDQTALLRAKRHNEAQKIPIRDLDNKTLARMTPRERLEIANGEIPSRFKLLGPNDDV
jgi:hypothetical protein